MKIPQELFNYSEKELKKLLVEDKFKATYLKDGPTIFKVKAKIAGYVIGNQVDCSSLDSFKLADSNFVPLLFDDLIRYKATKINDKLAEGDIHILAKVLKMSINNIVEKNNFEVVIRDEGNLDLILYFPELTITNTIGLVHVMKDIYVKFYFIKSNSKLYLKRIYMTRTTYSDQEVASNYTFSHLHSDIGKYSDTLCFGDDTPIARQVTKLRMGYLNGLSYFFILFKEYLQWESIEGSPYKLIEKIGNNSLHQSSPYHTDQDIEVFSNETLAYLKEFTYTYELSNGTYKVKLSSEAINIIDIYLSSIVPKDYLYYLINGISVRNSTFDLTNAAKMAGTDVIFKGENKKLRIYPSNETNSTCDKRVHRVVLKEVVDKIEEQFNQFLINKLNS